jgi:hypothetical protein
MSLNDEEHERRKRMFQIVGGTDVESEDAVWELTGEIAALIRGKKPEFILFAFAVNLMDACAGNNLNDVLMDFIFRVKTWEITAKDNPEGGK